MPNWDMTAWEEETEERMSKMKLKPAKRSVPVVLIDCIEGGVTGGLRKCQKWNLLPGEIKEEDVVRLISNYVLASIEEDFDLD